MDLVSPPDLEPLERLAASIREREAVVAVVGLGYVGLPLLVAIRHAGYPAIGLDTERGDTIQTSVVPFDTSVEAANLAALEAAKKADAAAARNTWIRNGVLGGVVLLLMGLAYRRSRKHSSAREEATSYVVEQLRQEQMANLDAGSRRIAQGLEDAADVLSVEQRRKVEERLDEWRQRRVFWRSWHRG